MPGNAIPRFTANANVTIGAFVTAQNTNSDGTGNITTPTMYIVLTAGANGSYVEGVRVFPVASAASTNTVATLIRLYLSSITSGATSNANTAMCAPELAIPIVAADGTTVAIPSYDIMLGFQIPANYTLLASTSEAAAASTGWRVIPVGAGDF